MRSAHARRAAFMACTTFSLGLLGCGGSGSGTSPTGTGGQPALAGTGGTTSTGGSTPALGTGGNIVLGSSGGSPATTGTGGGTPTGGVGAPPTGTGGASPDAAAPGTGGRATPTPDGGAGAQPGDAGLPPSDGGAHPPFTGPMVSGTVTVARATTTGRMVPGFAGFSFEKSHLTDGFFTGTNAPLIALFKLLGPGFVRFGGHDVDSRHWVPGAAPVAAGQTSASVGTADVDALAAFLTASGWKTIYGLNLQSETTPTADVAEAVYVTGKLGPSLHSFEIGNEWGSTLEARWRTFADAIKAAAPGALQTGPGACCGVGFPVSFAANEASRIILVTYHHYVGAAASASSTAALLLSPDTGLVSDTKMLVAAAAANNVRDGFRWGEINTFSGHGKAGVSDAFAAALWGVDDMLVSAENGATGVNYHGGGQNEDGNNCPSGPTSCSLPFRYSPIQEVNDQVTAAAPLFYGMLFVSRAGTGPMYQTNVTVPNNLNVSAYSIGHADGSTAIVVSNKDATNALNATINVGTAVTSATADYLQAPSLAATSGVTFAGSEISAAGAWQPKAPYALPTSGNTVTVLVPPMSAVLIHVD